MAGDQYNTWGQAWHPRGAIEGSGCYVSRVDGADSAGAPHHRSRGLPHPIPPHVPMGQQGGGTAQGGSAWVWGGWCTYVCVTALSSQAFATPHAAGMSSSPCSAPSTCPSAKMARWSCPARPSARPPVHPAPSWSASVAGPTSSSARLTASLRDARYGAGGAHIEGRPHHAATGSKSPWGSWSGETLAVPSPPRGTDVHPSSAAFAVGVPPPPQGLASPPAE